MFYILEDFDNRKHDQICFEFVIVVFNIDTIINYHIAQP